MKSSDISICQDLERLNIEIIQQGSLTNITLESSIKDQIVAAQRKDKSIAHIKDQIKSGKTSCFTIDEDGILWFKNRLVVPKMPELRKKILDEAHLSIFSIHPGSTKMYHDLRQRFWWTKMKLEIARYVSECDTCQCVKAVHMKTAGELHPLPVPS